MLILALDTSTRTTAVALLDGERLLGSHQDSSTNHSRTLMPAMDELLRQHGGGPADLDGVAAGIGPGSFTGVRIGLTVAKMLAWTASVPLVGISSLSALAQNGLDQDAHVCPAVDALKDEVFCARYLADSAGKLVQHQGEGAREPRSWAESLSQESGDHLFVGTGVQRYGQVFRDVLGSRAIIPDDESSHRVSAHALGLLALDRLSRSELDDPRTLEPMYCRLSEAELGIQNRQKRK